jgi:hypothetical protein
MGAFDFRSRFPLYSTDAIGTSFTPSFARAFATDYDI